MPSKISRSTVIALIAILTVAGFGRGYYRWKYPFGWSHCCDKQLANALREYAENHDGNFPTGGKTPEGSLSRLYPQYADANLLRGKTVSLIAVDNALKNEGELAPDTCGWYYVEGFSVRDDPHIAMFWDKAGLGHNGERLSDGGHTVFFVDLRSEYVSGSRWPLFLEEQQRLIASKKKGGNR
jgi:hypothetical protein